MGKDTNKQHMDESLDYLIRAQQQDPFSVLGCFRQGNQCLIRVFIPYADKVRLEDRNLPFTRIQESDFFEWRGDCQGIPEHFRISWNDQYHCRHVIIYPYTFQPQLSDFDLHLFGEGKHWHVYKFLGAHVCEIDNIHGVLFATWAPNARRVSVVGDFNHWNGLANPMRSRGGSGIWEIFIPGISPGSLYKYEIINQNDGSLHLKSDPYAQQFEMRPETASKVTGFPQHGWQDQIWLEKRAEHDWLHSAMSVYEVHLGSWQQPEGGGFLNYREIAHRLVEYVLPLGFTHLELLPVSEHPLDASWGYQTTGYYAPTSRFGSPDDFRYFVDYCHQHNLGVILDWVPAHFPKDSHGLALFDGSALYEHEDPRRGEHRDWGTLIYNYGRNEVKNFLLANALFWLDEFHIDGLRVDAVASMLYLDYSREEGDWLPNNHGGNENLEAIEFFRELNSLTHAEHPGSLMIAEESTSWPQVTRPTWLGGLGFSMKWNMGWMHDTLAYLKNDPVYRHYHHDQLTFGLLYAFTENFMLPFSHDEVVHGKGSMINKMPGDDWQRFANLRLLYSYMFTYPGKKLLFMGAEFAQAHEWQHDNPLDWASMDRELNQGIHKLVSDLNHLYRTYPALFYYDFEQNGFEWIDCHDAEQSVLSYRRHSDNEELVIILNFTPVIRKQYRIGVPEEGIYKEIFNSDSGYYGGGNIGNQGFVYSEKKSWMSRENSIEIILPPLAALVFRKE